MVGFSSFYGPGINNYAEFLALKEGLLLCKTLRLSVLIESDSMLMFRPFFLDLPRLIIRVFLIYS